MLKVYHISIYLHIHMLSSPGEIELRRSDEHLGRPLSAVLQPVTGVEIYTRNCHRSRALCFHKTEMKCKEKDVRSEHLCIDIRPFLVSRVFVRTTPLPTYLKEAPKFPGSI